MNIALITGSSGLVGSEAAFFFHNKKFKIIGIDNNYRKYFFGKNGDTSWKKRELKRKIPNYTHFSKDIRNFNSLKKIFIKFSKKIKVIVHAAAQPSHDWAAKEPLTDFGINAVGTLNLLELCRQYCPKAVFIYVSTNKVYGDSPNFIPLKEKSCRYEVSSKSIFSKGINESMSIDQSIHSLFGASKTAADLLVQEYGRNFGLFSGVFRLGCITGPGHSGAELHGFLNYLIKANINNIPYTIYGYKGKQVRDNIHSYDLVNCFWNFFKNPKKGEVYNIGGGRINSCSIIEIIKKIEDLTKIKMIKKYTSKNRTGDHIWYITSNLKFKRHYPKWKIKFSLDKILKQTINSFI
jgi:CDP-paratose 2-epimerase